MEGTILCVGEVLWDSLPAGLFLGGAPFNVACHLQALGENTAFAGRVGDDELGREIRRRMESRGLSGDLVQVDPELETGFVAVTLDARGSPTFRIVEPSAWDRLEPTPGLLDAARAARAVVYGSLAQRSETTRETIQNMLALSPRRVFDVNLRPPFVDRSVIEAGLQGAYLLKLNEDEWSRFVEWWGLPAELDRGARALAKAFGVQAVCVTRGDRGAALWRDGRAFEDPGFRADVVDAVGAGDAFLAGLLSGLLAGKAPAEALDFACALGAFVVTRRGATPQHDRGEIEKIRRARLG